MNIPKYDTEYFAGITAPYIDWVAGGNFDGYLIQKVLTFKEEGSRVEIHTKVIHKQNYDSKVEDSVIIGIFKPTEKDTITLYFEHFEMRGKILGELNELIAFSIWSRTFNKTEVYRLKE